MPKNKKRRKLDNVQSLAKANNWNLTGYDCNGVQDDSLASCMAEFAQHENKMDKEVSKGREKENLFTVKAASSLRWEEEQINTERAESWNCLLMAWMRTGKYTPGLLPSIDEEIARHFQVQELSKFLLAQGNDLRMPVFERFLLDSRLEDVKSRDPVLPMRLQHASSSACHRLEEELVQNGVQRQKAEKIVAELCCKIKVSGQELCSMTERFQRASPLKRGDRMDLEDNGETFKLVYSRKRWKKPFCFAVNKFHYEKLKDRFFRVHRKCETKLDDRCKQVLQTFHLLLVALMLRYSSISGGAAPSGSQRRWYAGGDS